MSAQKKTPADKAGAKESTTRDVSMTAHEEDHAATRAGAKPSIDAESLIRAGLPLIPLHRWDARDAKGRARGKSPIDGAWQSRDYDSREVLAQAERRGLNVGVRLPPTWMAQASRCCARRPTSKPITQTAVMAMTRSAATTPR